MSLYGLLFPRKLTALVRWLMVDVGPNFGLWLAVLVRILLAALFWLTAPVSHTPTIFRVLALLALTAAVSLPIMGTERLVRLIDRVTAWPSLAIRSWCLSGVAFGVFLLWSISAALF